MSEYDIVENVRQMGKTTEIAFDLVDLAVQNPNKWYKTKDTEFTKEAGRQLYHTIRSIATARGLNMEFNYNHLSFCYKGE